MKMFLCIKLLHATTGEAQNGWIIYDFYHKQQHFKRRRIWQIFLKGKKCREESCRFYNADMNMHTHKFCYSPLVLNT